jgi:hypothetical protein
MTTVSQRVRPFVVRLVGEPECDDCIAEKLDLSVRQHADHKVRELAGESGFKRGKDTCALCGATMLAIRSIQR